MPKKTPQKELVSVMTDSTVEALRDIAQLHVGRFATDASQAMLSGCVLLAIAVDSTPNRGDGFLYLLGLPRGVKVTPYLSNYFQP